MRRFLFTIFVLTLGLLPWAATWAQDDDPISAGLLGTFQGSGAYDINPLDWLKNTYEDLADEPIKKPIDIYLFMYKQAKEKPLRAAIQQSIKDYNVLAEKDVESVKKGEIASLPYLLRGGYCRQGIRDCIFIGPAVQAAEYILKPILEGIAKAGESSRTIQFKLTPEQIAAAFDIFTRKFNDDLEIADMQAELESETVITEIFANGDESDSGFDLLVDLEIIDLLLFGRPATLAGVSGPGNPPGANEIKIGLEALEEQQVKAEAQAQAEAAQGAQAAREDASSGTDGASTPGAGSEQYHPFTPLECYADSSFDNQIRAHRRAAGLPEAGGEGEQEGGSGADGAGGAAGSARRGGPSAPAGGVEDEEDRIETPALAGSWGRASICPPDQIWCVTIEAKMKRESSYLPADNCVACHIEKINDAFSKTLRTNLTPGKSTGLLFAMPMCKSGLNLSALLDMNIILLPSPIITPPNDDIVVKDVFLGNLETFIKRYVPFGADVSFGGLTSDNTPPPDVLDQASDRVSSQSGRGLITQRIAEISAQVEAARREALETLAATQATESTNLVQGQFKVLYPEIDQMTAYFTSWMGLYEKILARDGACDVLLNDKEACQ